MNSGNGDVYSFWTQALSISEKLFPDVIWQISKRPWIYVFKELARLQYMAKKQDSSQLSGELYQAYSKRSLSMHRIQLECSMKDRVIIQLAYRCRPVYFLYPENKGI